jgi:zinc ribbon protein
LAIELLRGARNRQSRLTHSQLPWPSCNFSSVEHSCHRCEAPVEDGVSFCPGCGAPQIRVPIAVVEGPVADASAAEGARAVRVRGAIEWAQAMPVAVGTGVAATLLAFFTSRLLPATLLVWMIVGGGACVILYQRRRRQALITAGAGARLGALSGLFGFCAFAVTISLLLLAARGPELRQQLRQSVEQAAAQSADPQAQEVARRMATPEGLAILLAFVMVFLLFAFVILGSVGGMLAASLTRRDEPGPMPRN